MGPAKLANYNSQLSTEINRRACTVDTRKEILSNLDEWSDSPEAKPICWINGMAGTGKTTIAYTLSAMLESRGQLGASFFCTRASAECQDANRIIPTIAYQLAEHSTPFQSGLDQVLENYKNISSLDISKQFEGLLKRPLLEVKDKIPGNIVVVIDALDECNNKNTVQLVLDTLLQSRDNLPLKFLITSRPEPIIYSAMTSTRHNSCSILHLHEIEKTLVRADIKLFLQEQLAFMFPAPSPAEVMQLAELSDNLFIYAATALRYIRPCGIPVNHHERLAAMLAIIPQSTQLATIDSLYSVILSGVLDTSEWEPLERKRIQRVLWTIACSQAPLPIETLAELAELDSRNEAWVSVQPLRSILYISGSETSGTTSILHASFRDYLFSQERSKDFFCDKSEQNLRLARRCLMLMKDGLQSSPNELTLRYIEEQLPIALGEDLSNVSHTLSYACRYWVHHLNQANSRMDELPGIIREFFAYQSLSWVQVLKSENCIYDTVVDSMLPHGISYWICTHGVSPLDIPLNRLKHLD